MHIRDQYSRSAPFLNVLQPNFQIYALPSWPLVKIDSQLSQIPPFLNLMLINFPITVELRQLVSL